MRFGKRTLLALWLLSFFGCSQRIPAENIGQLQAGRTFNQQGGFMIGPGDQLDIFVFGEERLSGRFNVSPTGLLAFPLITPISVSGTTTAQLSKKLEYALDRYLKSPKVAVSLLGIKSFQVYFGGEVKRVGAVSLTSETSFLQAITLAGGITEFATGRIILVRQLGSGKVRRFALQYDDILSGEKFVDSISLESGDVIVAE